MLRPTNVVVVIASCDAADDDCEWVRLSRKINMCAACVVCSDYY